MRTMRQWHAVFAGLLMRWAMPVQAQQYLVLTPTAEQQAITVQLPANDTRAPRSQHAPDRQARLSRLDLMGMLRTEAAIHTRSPGDLTKLRATAYLRGSYSLTPSERSSTQTVFHFAMRAHYDAVYALTRRYPGSVREDEQD